MLWPVRDVLSVQSRSSTWHKRGEICLSATRPKRANSTTNFNPAKSDNGAASKNLLNRNAKPESSSSVGHSGHDMMVNDLARTKISGMIYN